jgi:hypothetical protein
VPACSLAHAHESEGDPELARNLRAMLAETDPDLSPESSFPARH